MRILNLKIGRDLVNFGMDTLLMARHGEEMALNLLTQKGYNLRHRNWRRGKAEIDLIMQDNTEIVFVEVKTRTTDDFGEPASFVTRPQQKLIIRAANDYIQLYDIDSEARFDVVAIILDPKIVVDHIENAFYPGVNE